MTASTTNCINTNNPITLAQGGFAGTTAISCFNATSPLTTKGDIIAYSGTHNVALAVGTNNQFLTADSTAGNGVKWASQSALVSSYSITSPSLTVTGSPVTTSGTITVELPASMSGKNLLVNGDMQVWQRGAGGSAAIAVGASTTTYTVDRWQLKTGASQACTVTQVAGATSGSYLAKVQRNNGQTGTTAILFCTSLPRNSSIGAAGNVITLSFKALCGANYSAGSNALAVTVYSGTGTTDISGINGAFTGTANAISQTATLTTSSQTFTYSSSALGSTVTQLAVQFSFTPSGTAGANDWFEVSDVQLEIATQATPFQRKSFSSQLKDCQFFYQKSFSYGTVPAQNTGLGTGELYLVATVAGVASNLPYTVNNSRNMRAAPSYTAFDPVAGDTSAWNVTRSTNSSTSTRTGNQNHQDLGGGTGKAGFAIGDRMAIQYTLESELT